MSEQAEIFTVDDVAERLKVGRSTVYALIRKGTIPSVRVGSQIRVTQAQLDKFLQPAP